MNCVNCANFVPRPDHGSTLPMLIRAQHAPHNHAGWPLHTVDRTLREGKQGENRKTPPGATLLENPDPHYVVCCARTRNCIFLGPLQSHRDRRAMFHGWVVCLSLLLNYTVTSASISLSSSTLAFQKTEVEWEPCEKRVFWALVLSVHLIHIHHTIVIVPDFVYFSTQAIA